MLSIFREIIKAGFFSAFFLSSSYASSSFINFIEQPLQGIHTDAIAVYKNGELVFERYKNGTASTKYPLWSMSKSISSLLFGIGADKGFWNLSDKVYPLLRKLSPALNNHCYKNITFKNLLHMSSGLVWNEGYDGNPFRSDVVKMLYFESPKGISKYLTGLDCQKKPGDFFLYSSGDSNIMSLAMSLSLEEKLAKTYPWEWLFDPMDIKATFETDKEKYFISSSYVFMSLPDLAKIGDLILNKGLWNNKQLVSSKFLDFIVKPSTGLTGNCSHEKHSYGGHFWLNVKCPQKETPPMAKTPENTILMRGYAGQYMLIYPTEKIVVIRFGHDSGTAKFDLRKLSQSVRESFL